MSGATPNPLLRLISAQGTVILDGGLASTLEERGFDLDDPLWSARVLLEDPAAIGRVHGDFLAAGADCITTATYQATLPGLRRRGLDDGQARAQLSLAVDLAVAARDDFWAHAGDHPEHAGRLRPLVAASVGPYGAYLADGSEYAGNYGTSPQELDAFHRDRWRILAAGSADLLACETLPGLDEAGVLLDLLHETPGRWAWFTFACRDGARLCDGTPFAEAAALCSRSPQVAAVGVNCTAPAFIAPLLEIGRRVTDKPLIVYPNAGDIYHRATKTWTPVTGGSPLADLASGWAALGAKAIGGCCRVGPSEIAALRRVLLG